MLNKRRRDSHVAENVEKRLFSTPQEKKEKRRKINKNYQTVTKEHRANTLHPDSIAMENPQWKPELLLPSGARPTSRVSEEMVILDFSGSPIYVEAEVREPPQ
jgi:hypothetical protein